MAAPLMLNFYHFLGSDPIKLDVHVHEEDGNHGDSRRGPDVHHPRNPELRHTLSSHQLSQQQHSSQCSQRHSYQAAQQNQRHQLCRTVSRLGHGGLVRHPRWPPLCRLQYGIRQGDQFVVEGP